MRTPLSSQSVNVLTRLPPLSNKPQNDLPTTSKPKRAFEDLFTISEEEFWDEPRGPRKRRNAGTLAHYNLKTSLNGILEDPVDLSDNEECCSAGDGNVSERSDDASIVQLEHFDEGQEKHEAEDEESDFEEATYIPEAWLEILQRWPRADPQVFPPMQTFLEDVSDETMKYIGKVNCPHGTPGAKVLQLPHWAPENDKLPDYGTLLDDTSCFSIKLLKSIFPDLEEHFVFDLYPRRHDMFKKNGQRYTNKEIYKDDPDREHYEKLAKDLIELSICEIIILYGVPVRKWFFKTFAPGAFSGNMPVTKVVINGIERSVVSMNHPSYLGLWIDHEHAVQNLHRLTTLADLGVSIDLSRLKNLLNRIVTDDRTLSRTADRVTHAEAMKTWAETKMDKRYREHYTEANLASERQVIRKARAVLPPTEAQRAASRGNIKKAQAVRGTEAQLKAAQANVKKASAKARSLPRTELQLATGRKGLKAAHAVRGTERQLKASSMNAAVMNSLPKTQRQRDAARENLKNRRQKSAVTQAETQILKDKAYGEQHGQKALDERLLERSQSKERHEKLRLRKLKEGLVLVRQKNSEGRWRQVWVKINENKRGKDEPGEDQIGESGTGEDRADENEESEDETSI